MMAERNLSTWGKWQQTRNTLSTSLALNVKTRNESAPGSAEKVPLNENIQKTLDDMQTHALNGLRQVDLTIADQNLVDKITKSSEEAKKEADRIKEATASVAKLTKLVENLTKLVKYVNRL